MLEGYGQSVIRLFHFPVESILLVSFGGVVSMVTALSVCAISTNGFIKEGNLRGSLRRFWLANGKAKVIFGCRWHLHHDVAFFGT